MLDSSRQAIVHATVPVLEAHGETLTCHFYQRMFRENPEVRAFFNPAHQRSGGQQQALAGAICAYARHIEDPSALAGAIELIAQKHASLGIRPEHYPIVGENLLASIREVLGDAADDELIEAWEAAYGVLAEVFVEREAEIYAEQEKRYGWRDFRPFTVARREVESDAVVSFHLVPADGGDLPAHDPGQYVTVRVPGPDGEPIMRNYSLSNAAGAAAWRISVKREHAPSEGVPAGVGSTYLHTELAEGDVIELAPPCGEFVLDLPEDRQRPLLFVAGGVGVTPLLSMLHAALAADEDRPIVFLQCALNGDVRPFSDELEALAGRHPNLRLHVRYSEPTVADREEAAYDSEGFVDDELLDHLVGDAEASWWLCGPTPMLAHLMPLLRSRGVAESEVHHECFGPAVAF